MKKYQPVLKTFTLVCTIFLAFCVNAFSASISQPDENFAAEQRPFDYSDKFYEINGVNPAFIINRRNGADGYSVFDFIRDERYRNVRVLAVSTAYDAEGRVLFWNNFGELFYESFLNKETANVALSFPIYTFPSAAVKNGDRQSVVIDRGNLNPAKNPLGLGVLVEVEFTDRIYTEKGRAYLTELIKRNGESVDGMPIIRTVAEILDMTRKNLVTQRIKGISDDGQPPFVIAHLLQDPTNGAIAPDAFLMKSNELQNESYFASEFECLQKSGNWCSVK